jgi:hypothetical protein
MPTSGIPISVLAFLMILFLECDEAKMKGQNVKTISVANDRKNASSHRINDDPQATRAHAGSDDEMLVLTAQTH